MAKKKEKAPPLAPIDDLSSILEDYTEAKWEDYPGIPGFAVLLQVPDAPKSMGLMAKAGFEEETPPAAGGQKKAPELRVDDYNREVVRFAVAGWRGLTVAALRQLTGVAVKGRKDQEVAFNPGNRDLVLKLSPAFYAWGLTQINARSRGVRQEEEEAKNSSATPDTTPTRPASVALAAGGNGGSSA
jgi:hypothetical protein